MTSIIVREKIFSIIPPKLLKVEDLKIYDLGSGWGGLAFALAREYPHQTIIGIEISFIPWLYSRVRLLIWPHDNLNFWWGNFFKINLSDAKLVICYLFPKTMWKLSKKLKNELICGSFILSNTFSFRDWVASKEERANDFYQSSIFLYEVRTNELECFSKSPFKNPIMEQ